MTECTICKYFHTYPNGEITCFMKQALCIIDGRTSYPKDCKKVIETVNGWYMENPKQKVELDDIVGLVKTDEPTDSVQLKKEAQLSICEKRLIELEKENEQLKKELDKLKVVNEMLSMDFSNSEHELWRENEQLKQKIKQLQHWNKCLAEKRHQELKGGME